MGFDPDELPVVTLFRGATFNGLTRMVLDAPAVPTEWARAKTFRETIGVSGTAFSNVRDQAVAYGLIEPSTTPSGSSLRQASTDETARMPRYRIPDSPTVQLLRSFHSQYDPTADDDVSDDVIEVLLPDVMELNGRARLIGWFLAAANPDTKYSISKMGDVAPVGHTTVRNHIETLVDYGIVTTHETSRGSQTYTTYQFNPNSTVAAVLYDLNEVIANHRAAYYDDQ